ncbi:hypothetical protein EVAR_642_1 [Eumeta japonica]|uniref:Uncharacterized protein n=1 Tax=Eumeta variegata TaxID=151549 RepID=A0A4C1SBA3_EUMVA|nr:hypothetical protein EVAR_642_1 [Eumeta japonica]
MNIAMIIVATSAPINTMNPRIHKFGANIARRRAREHGKLGPSRGLRRVRRDMEKASCSFSLVYKSSKPTHFTTGSKTRMKDIDIENRTASESKMEEINIEKRTGSESRIKENDIESRTESESRMKDIDIENRTGSESRTG